MIITLGLGNGAGDAALYEVVVNVLCCVYEGGGGGGRSASGMSLAPSLPETMARDLSEKHWIHPSPRTLPSCGCDGSRHN